MKKYILLIFILLIRFAVHANEGPIKTFPCNLEHMLYEDFCDSCGCGSNGGSMGFGTGLNNNFVGLRYISQKYRSRDGIFDNSPWINENFNTAQLWGKLPISNRIIINALLPYHAHNRTFTDNTEQKISGLGDATLLAYYKIIKPFSDSIISITPKHILQIGGGLKLPTGSFEALNNEGSVNPSFQLGTGSWDYLLALNYGLIHRNWGISTMLNYTVKTENSVNYQFGNQLNLTINAFKTYYASNAVALTPQIGIGAEHYEQNREFRLAVNDTKGDVLFARLGFETTYNRFAIGVSSLLPISQNLNNGKVQVKNRFSVYFNINI